MTDLDFLEEEILIPPTTPEFILVLRRTIGKYISRWMIGATFVYVGIFLYIMNNDQAAWCSIIALGLHLIGLVFHRNKFTWASTWNLVICLFHLTYLDIFILHTTLTVYLWMMCIAPFAVMACATTFERIMMIILAPSMMITCLVISSENGMDLGAYLGIISIIGTTLLMTAVTHWSLQLIERSQLLLRNEYQRSEHLLLNVLPEEVVDRLKGDEIELRSAIIADNYPDASVLFADIVGFTELSSRLSPSELVRILNDYFTAFDELSLKHKVEKIKTIGDAYMVASGILRRDASSLDHLARFALDMLIETEQLNAKHSLNLSLRIGLHHGPVTAGVIGSWKFIYDLWGDTVNVASRMESHGLPGKIHVSKEVKEALESRFELIDRGIQEIKGKGKLQTYILLSEYTNNTD